MPPFCCSIAQDEQHGVDDRNENNTDPSHRQTEGGRTQVEAGPHLVHREDTPLQQLHLRPALLRRAGPAHVAQKLPFLSPIVGREDHLVLPLADLQRVLLSRHPERVQGKGRRGGEDGSGRAEGEPDLQLLRLLFG